MSFRYLSEEPCPNCGRGPGEEGHGALMASTVTERGREVYLLCQGCGDGIRDGVDLDEARIRSALALREGAVPMPESIRG